MCDRRNTSQTLSVLLTTARPPRRMKGCNPRHGVLLLVVLSLLTLFVLLGLTFLLIAGKYRRTTVSILREPQRLEPAKLLDEACRQLIRDTGNTSSALLRQSLLADKYGKPGIQAVVIECSAQDAPSQDVVALDVASMAEPPATLNGPLDAWMGREITVMSGAAAGCTSRILRQIAGAADAQGNPVDRLYTLPFSSPHGERRPAKGDQLLINDPPFNGTGAGYNGGESLDATVNLDFGAARDLPVAFVMNHAYHARKWGNDGLTRIDQAHFSGGLDESYDAADFQNPYLSCTISGGAAAAPRRRTLLPSFHRPDLVQYVASGMDIPLDGLAKSFTSEQRSVLRTVITRPLQFDHPNFQPGGTFPMDGNRYSGLGFNPVDGPWDVDNDGDNEPDSVWLDLGFPPHTTPDGRQIKPLFAILVRDLDGRVNVNAAGNLAQRNSTWFHQPTDPDYPLPQPVTIGGIAVALPSGLGIGPAEIHPGGVLPGTSAWDPLVALVEARYRSAIEPNSGVFPGREGNDSASRVREPGGPGRLQIPGNGSDGSAYLSPSDRFGRLVSWIDNDTRQPTYDARVSSAAFSESTDDPYEIDLLHPGTADHPIAEDELEPYLRHNDYDAVVYRSRGARLTSAATPLTKVPDVDLLLTTRSFEVPAPPVAPVVRDALATIPCGSIVELFRRRMAARGLTDAEIERQMDLLCPWELRRGEKMDINRPWGNGVDDDPRGGNGSGVVDDPGEFPPGGGGSETTYISIPDARVRWPSQLDGRSGQSPRVVFARHLFCLAMFLKDHSVVFPVVREEPGLPLAIQRQLTARRLAQWAVNAVDFRDADLIMTGFEYDQNPYDGWNVDGDLNTEEPIPDRQVVWGCETPLLLLTETLALHDRRVEDLVEGGFRREDLNRDGLPDDNDLDQPRIPQGSLFVELFCPPSAAQNQPSLDLFTGSGNVDLERRAADGRPVWRIGISKTYEALEAINPTYREPIDRMASVPNTAKFVPGPEDLERFIWFTHRGPIGDDPRSRNTYFNQAKQPAQVAPGGYVVVGPRSRTTLGLKRSKAGRGDASDQSITLREAGAQAGRIERRDLDGKLISRRAATIVLAAAPRPTKWRYAGPSIGVNVSEPLIGPDYYAEPDASSANARADGYYRMPKDDLEDGGRAGEDAQDPDSSRKSRGFRQRSSARLGEWISDNSTGTDPKPNMARTGLHRYRDRNSSERRWRTAYLQRIANPLVGWHPRLNPYITVDWIPIDLTVFNGSSVSEEFKLRGKTYDLDPADPQGSSVDALPHSCERGTNDSAQGPNRLWSFELTLPESHPSSVSTAADEIFAFELRETLGGRNRSYRSAERPYFPWIQWNNRPYVSHMELAMVPSCSADRLGFEFQTNAAANPYRDYSRTRPTQDFRAIPYGHLLNFLQGDGVINHSFGMWRCLDFLHVPSRFVGTTRPLSYTSNGPEDGEPGQYGIDHYWAPFHQIPEMREPGKINLNTVFDGRVWNALTAAYPEHFQRNLTTTGPFTRFILSRQGYLDNPSGTVPPYAFDPDYPSVFANPFRAMGSGTMVPPLRGRGQMATGVHASLLRESPDAPGVPLFGRSLRTDSPYYRDPRREPQFHYEGIQRLANLTTTQSNVFAVWITLGLFEVEPWRDGVLAGPAVMDAAHPDGLSFAHELGGATGDFARHRSFYLIDRSIAAGFVPGADLNTSRMIILRRFVE